MLRCLLCPRYSQTLPVVYIYMYIHQYCYTIMPVSLQKWISNDFLLSYLFFLSLFCCCCLFLSLTLSFTSIYTHTQHIMHQLFCPCPVNVLVALVTNLCCLFIFSYIWPQEMLYYYAFDENVCLLFYNNSFNGSWEVEQQYIHICLSVHLYRMCWPKHCTTTSQSLQMSCPSARVISWQCWSVTHRDWMAGGSVHYMAAKALSLGTVSRSWLACMTVKNSNSPHLLHQIQLFPVPPPRFSGRSSLRAPMPLQHLPHHLLLLCLPLGLPTSLSPQLSTHPCTQPTPFPTLHSPTLILSTWCPPPTVPSQVVKVCIKFLLVQVDSLHRSGKDLPARPQL